jgi:beta-mannosidase
MTGMVSSTRRRRPLLQLAGLMLAAVALPALSQPSSSVELDGVWQFRQAESSDQHGKDADARTWRAARVPGTVHTDLLALGAIPDPYKGQAESRLQWIGLADWEYRRTFDVASGRLDNARSDLVFEGLDTFADVYLNGEKLLEADNFHRTWRVPVQGRLKAQGNELRVVLHSPIRRVLPQVLAMPHKIAGNYPSPWGDEPKDAMTVNFVRKPGYHYGWDWGPRYVTAGIWKPVRLESWDAVRIGDVQLRQDSVTAKLAEARARVAIDVARAGRYALHLWQVAPDGARTQVAEQVFDAKPGQRTLEAPLRIANPKRWYPAGYGAQPLYRFDAQIVRDGEIVTRASERTGLRSVELRRDQDATGQGFSFVINGVPVFAKGANSIPFDMFPSRTSDAQIRRILTAARDANMNMLRVWGGGHYERDAFYEMADELGLMIWQDFMFGGGMQPAYESGFRASVVAEARDQVRRLRDHPSIVLWCGNNEEEIAWKNWGQGKQLIEADPDFARRVWDGYVQLFGRDLRKVVADEAGGIAYWASSPSNDLAEQANTPEAGDMHYWSVWVEKKPVEEYLNVTPRFMSEFGLQAWPSLRTVRDYAGDAPLAVDSPVVVAHQKFLAGKGNERILDYIRMHYGDRPLQGTRDFDDFVYLSQVMQAEGIELAALHHRASRPVTMGSLYWQLNDVWPGASWSGIDWYGRPKALQFHARRFFAPVAVAALRKDGQTTVSLLSDRTQATRGELRMRVFDLDGRLLRERRMPVDLPALAATIVLQQGDAGLLGDADPRRTVAVFDLAVAGEPPSRDVVYFAAARDIAWPDPQLQTALHRDGDHYRLDLSAEAFARAVWIDFGDLDAAPQDNALTLAPGETVSLRVDSPGSLAELHKALRTRSLADTLYRDQ